MSNMLVRALAVVGALTVLWLLMVGAVATYDAIDDGSMMDGMGDMMGGMGDLGDMQSMMESMMAGGGAETTGSASGRGEVSIADFEFVPSRLTVTVGTVVEWTNEDAAPHTATARDNSFDSGRLGQGETFEMRYGAAGTFEYFCELHPWMEGRVIVQ